MSIKNYSRTQPYLSRIQERAPLTGPGSTKKTIHVVLEIESDHFPFKPGDSIGVLPQNDLHEVAEILKKSGMDPKSDIHDPRTNTTLSLHEHLLNKANIGRVSAPYLKSLLESAKVHDHPLFIPENKAKLTEFLHTHSLIDILTLYPTPLPDVAKLMPLLPRFYSIANSALVYPNEIHLTVAYVSYQANGRERLGVGSHFLCTHAIPHETPIPIYLQPSHHFTIPEDPNASIILIGPGTGVAPYRAFLQERMAKQAPGRNWLFFGERHRATDYYYASYWDELEKQGHLRLDLAFSRDGAQKCYVQHKMYEQRKSLWSWLQEGSFLYVCGDAEEMAKDVEAMLQKIAREEGGMSEEDARLYIKRLRGEKRYLTDVY